MIWHTCGYFGKEALESIDRDGALGIALGKLHPLLSLPRSEVFSSTADPLAGGTYCLGGDEAAISLGERVVGALGGTFLKLHPGQEHDRRYHASAALLCGGYVALTEACVAALSTTLSADEPLERAREVLSELMRSVEDRLRAGMGPRALTGPAARGARELVEGHLEALGEVDRATEELYRALLVHMERLRKKS